MTPMFAVFAQSSVTTTSQGLSVWQAYALVVVGILVSIVLPILMRYLHSIGGAGLSSLWSVVKPYLVVGALSLVAAVVVLAFAGQAIETWQWQNALLAGYAWDSTLQKIAKP